MSPLIVLMLQSWLGAREAHFDSAVDAFDLSTILQLRHGDWTIHVAGRHSAAATDYVDTAVSDCAHVDLRARWHSHFELVVDAAAAATIDSRPRGAVLGLADDHRDAFAIGLHVQEDRLFRKLEQLLVRRRAPFIDGHGDFARRAGAHAHVAPDVVDQQPRHPCGDGETLRPRLLVGDRRSRVTRGEQCDKAESGVRFHTGFPEREVLMCFATSGCNAPRSLSRRSCSICIGLP